MKKQTYKVGDIFQILSKENLTGFGRVLRKLGDSILIEMYDIESYKQNELKVIYTKCCWDGDLKNGKWQVVDCKEVEKNLKIPDFWGTRTLDRSYFKVTGETILTGYDEDGEKRINITENDIIGLEKYGVAPPEWIYDYYLERLKRGNDNGLLGI